MARDRFIESNDRGAFGESEARFAIGRLGWELYSRPLRLNEHDAEGKGTYDSGFDFVAYDPVADRLKLIDNKAYTDPEAVISKATALSDNLEANLRDARDWLDLARERAQDDAEIRARVDHVLDLLDAGIEALQRGDWLPNNVEAVLMNAGGFAEYVGRSLSALGIGLEDVIPETVRQAQEQDLRQLAEDLKLVEIEDLLRETERLADLAAAEQADAAFGEAEAQELEQGRAGLEQAEPDAETLAEVERGAEAEAEAQDEAGQRAAEATEAERLAADEARRTEAEAEVERERAAAEADEREAIAQRQAEQQAEADREAADETDRQAAEQVERQADGTAERLLDHEAERQAEQDAEAERQREAAQLAERVRIEQSVLGRSDEEDEEDRADRGEA